MIQSYNVYKGMKMKYTVIYNITRRKKRIYLIDPVQKDTTI